MLAMANQDGYVGATLKSLAILSRTTEDECRVALDTFLAPDANSSSSAHEGRRIANVEGGWTILNYERYRNAVSDDPNAVSARERTRKYREKMKNSVTVTSRDVTLRDTASASASSEGGVGETKPPKKPVVSVADDQAFLDEITKLYTYVNVPVELVKMRGWLMQPKNKHRTLTRKFVIGWLNKIDRPLEVNTGHWRHKTTKGLMQPGFKPQPGKEADYEWIA